VLARGRRRAQRGSEALRAAVAAWLVARVAVGVGYVAARVAADELAPVHRPVQLAQGLFAWDAAFYRDIADRGYGGVAREGLRFFPLLPLASRALGWLFLGHVGLALVLIVQVAALASGVLLHRLGTFELRDREVAGAATWLLALLPPATVLVLGYAEGLLLLTSIGAFLAYRRKRWWPAAVLGVLAGLCRPVGAALALPALIEALRDWRRHRPAALVARAAAVAGPVVGTALYLGWVQHADGNWRLPLQLQNSADLRGGWSNPLSTVSHAVRAAANGGGLGEALHLPWVGLFLVLLVVCFRVLPVSYGLYSAALLLAALTGHTLGSFERYGLAAFPLVLALAVVVTHLRAERFALLASAIGLTAFTTLIFLNAFVP
jgi:hypothetical protein